MISPQPGQRLQIDGNPECHIRVMGRDPQRLGIAAVNPDGKVCAFESKGDSDWFLPSFAPLGDQFDIVAYVTDDRLGGFVNQSYPLHVEILGEAYDFPAATEQLGAIILAEVYVRNGVRRLKVSNEGYTFGIDAYVRARKLNHIQMPFRALSPTDRSDQDERYPSTGEAMASGSGVIVAPGLVVTNAHVIEDGQSFRIGRTQQTLTPLFVDSQHDLALLKGEVAGEPLPLRIASPIWLGESVMAAGFPLMDLLGSDLKVTTGNISGLTGSASDVSRFQFTAPIGSGSSGGAIIDEFGNLVGITSASLAHGNIRQRGSISENVNFGIRAAMVFEMIAAAGLPLPQTAALADNNRREVVNRLRGSVVSIIVSAP